jgi:carnitine O-octanoyltransferase
MDSGSEGSFQIKRKALLEAIRTHERLMEECKLGKGSDRHLFGLMCIAEENNLPIPKLFSQKAFTTSGGPGHFVLSTSTCGYTGKILIKKEEILAHFLKL